VAIAPQVFDRAEKNFETGYDQPSMEKGRAARGKIKTEDLLLDTQAAIDYISALVVPGSSLIVSDHGLGEETGEGTNFIVVTR